MSLRTIANTSNIKAFSSLIATFSDLCSTEAPFPWHVSSQCPSEGAVSSESSCSAIDKFLTSYPTGRELKERSIKLLYFPDTFSLSLSLYLSVSRSVCLAVCLSFIHTLSLCVHQFLSAFLSLGVSRNVSLYHFS